MSLSDKVRHLSMLSASIAKLNLQADMERRVLDLQARDKERVRTFQELQDRLELELRMAGERVAAKESHNGNTTD